MPNRETVRELVTTDTTCIQILDPKELEKVITDECLIFSKRELAELGISNYDQLLLFSRILLAQLQSQELNFLVRICVNSVIIVSLRKNWEQHKFHYLQKAREQATSFERRDDRTKAVV